MRVKMYVLENMRQISDKSDGVIKEECKKALLTQILAADTTLLLRSEVQRYVLGRTR